MDTLTLGCNHYDIYIESLDNIELINKIKSLDEDITFYIKEGIHLEIENAFIVGDIEEVITQINYNTSGYSASIFTENKANA